MKRIAFILAIFMLFSFVGCKSNTDNNHISELTVCTGPDPTTLDPALNNTVDAGTLIIHAFEGLYKMNEKGVPIPGQAQSHEISEDGLIYTFKLRENLKWSDNKDLTAKDFVYSWNRAISPDLASSYAGMFEIVSGYDTGILNVTAPDDHTLVVVLTSKSPYFLELTAFPTFYPVREDIIKEHGEKWAINANTYIGNGAYKMSQLKFGSNVTYKKNDNYWNHEKVGPSSIKFILMADESAQLAAYNNKELLFIDSIPQDEIENLKVRPDFHKEPQLGIYYLSFNVLKAPLNNPKIRKALTLAIDRDFICKKIGKSEQEPAGGFVPKGVYDYDNTTDFRDVGGDFYNPYASSNEANLKIAKDLLKEAGYENGKGLPTIEYLYNEATTHKQIGEAIASMWDKLGIKVELVSQDWATLTNSRKNGDYMVARNGWVADYNSPTSFLNMWVTKGGNNDAQWSNANYDKIINQVKLSSSQKEQTDLLHEAENILFDEWVLCPIYYNVDTYLKSENLKGAFSSTQGYKNFIYSSIKQ